jgi:hypothetical protein
MAIKTPTVVAVLACALLALLPAAAGGHRFNAKTTAEVVSGGPDGAEGTVSSPKAACKRNRLVELFRVDELGGEDQSYGTDRTDRNGNWSVEASLFAGEYYVTVTKSRAASASQPGQHRHRCKKGKSKKKRL